MSQNKDGNKKPLEKVSSQTSQHVGPEYRSNNEKPEATVSQPVNLDNVHILPQTSQLIALLT